MKKKKKKEMEEEKNKIEIRKIDLIENVLRQKCYNRFKTFNNDKSLLKTQIKNPNARIFPV